MNRNKLTKSVFAKTALITFIVLVFAVCAQPASAYTGGVAIFPPLTGGPNHKTVSNFPVNTEDTNPEYIFADLNYVHSVVIETDPGINSHLLISEYPSGDTLAFSFTVPKPFQDALISATIYFWGPDVDSLDIIHEHQGEEPTTITATKVEPAQTNPDGNVLWAFTTTSFSDFYLSHFTKKINQNLPVAAIFILALVCLSTYFVFKQS